jgi:hypothetical protein
MMCDDSRVESHLDVYTGPSLFFSFLQSSSHSCILQWTTVLLVSEQNHAFKSGTV